MSDPKPLDGNPFLEDSMRYAAEATLLNQWSAVERAIFAQQATAQATLALAFETRRQTDKTTAPDHFAQPGTFHHDIREDQPVGTEQLTGTDQLYTLPIGTVILLHDGDAAQKRSADKWDRAGFTFEVYGTDLWITEERPATILYTPTNKD